LNGKGDKVHIVGRAISFPQHTAADYISIFPVKNQFGSDGIHPVHHRIFVQDFGISGYEINAGLFAICSVSPADPLRSQISMSFGPWTVKLDRGRETTHSLIHKLRTHRRFSWYSSFL
jgi:hypothetical protein